MIKFTYALCCDSFELSDASAQSHVCAPEALVSAWVAPPETEEQRQARIKRKARIDELLTELENLGWEPPGPEYRDDRYDD